MTDPVVETVRWTGSAPLVASIVEGEGEVAAVPILLRRLGAETLGVHLQATTPHRVPRGKMRQGHELKRAIELQARRVQSGGGVIVLLDSDDDEPAALRQDLQAIADEAREGAAVVTLAVREYEAWFLAGIASLRSHRDVRDDASYEADPERKRDCKGALTANMTAHYSPTRHQAAFSSILDLDAALARSPSFREFHEALAGIITSATTE